MSNSKYNYIFDLSIKRNGGATGQGRKNKMSVSAIEIYKLLQNNFKPEEAEKIVSFISNQNEKAMEEAKQKFLTKEDKIDLITRMDAHFRWLVGIMLTAISLAVTLIKIL